MKILNINRLKGIKKGDSPHFFKWQKLVESFFILNNTIKISYYSSIDKRTKNRRQNKISSTNGVSLNLKRYYICPILINKDISPLVKKTLTLIFSIVIKLIKNGVVESLYNSGISFYTLKGSKIKRNRITPNHMGVSYNNNPLYHLLLEHPLDKTSIHNIRLLFKVKDIWKFLSSNSQFKLNPISKDIKLDNWIIDKDFFISVKVHRTDTITISIGCSYRPVSLDINGIIRFTSVLTRVEERISGILHNILKGYNYGEVSTTQIIPPYTSWIVTMWHLNRDGLTEYSGDKFNISWKDAQNIIIRAYSKQFKDKICRIRLERQEYPNKSIFEAINEKLGIQI